MSGGVTSIHCREVADTEAFGARLGAALERGRMVSLEGPLGAGKTSLVRGIAAGAGADPEAVKSPTFVLHHVYPGTRMRLHHIDLYRLGAGAVIDMLDLDTHLEDGAVVVEWGDLASLQRWKPIRVAASVPSGSGRTFTLLTGDAPPQIVAAWNRPS